MLLHLILGSAALIAGLFSIGLLLAIIGIRRGDHGKRLAGLCRPYRGVRPVDADRLAWLRHPQRHGRTPMNRAADLTAVVVVSARHCNDFSCEKCRAQVRWLRRKAWRSRKSPNRFARDRKR